MVVGVQRDANLMLAGRQPFNMIIRAIDAVDFRPVHIDMGMAGAVNIGPVDIFRRPLPILGTDGDSDATIVLGDSNNADADGDCRLHRPMAHRIRPAAIRIRWQRRKGVKIDAKSAGGSSLESQFAGRVWGHRGGEVVPVQVDFARLVAGNVQRHGIAPLDLQILPGQAGGAVDDVQVNGDNGAGGGGSGCGYGGSDVWRHGWRCRPACGCGRRRRRISWGGGRFHRRRRIAGGAGRQRQDGQDGGD